MSHIKLATNENPILDIIKQRWSARAFNEKSISKESIKSLLEAARWAASANNEQPWQYLVAYKNTESFSKIHNCLMPGNQPWAKNAAVLLVSIARKTFEANQLPNYYAHHDVGMANANLLMQATSMEIYGHIMAGFNKQALIESLNLNENLEPVCVIALGYLADAETLEEPFKTREMTPRSRKSINEFASEI